VGQEDLSGKKELENSDQFEQEKRKKKKEK
jgi:hypothetical protein